MSIYPTSPPEVMQRDFPRLKTWDYLGAATPQYNCISWMLGRTDRPLWPGRRWDNVDDTQATLDTFEKVLFQQGFSRLQRVPSRYSPQREYVALYGHSPDHVTHGARYKDYIGWTSKIGRDALIYHRLPELTGVLYGTVLAVYSRKP